MAVDPVSLAITAALTAANMAMTALQEHEGPRIKDPGASLADYGTPMNYVLGRRVVSCPCIFAKEIEERKKKRKGKAGKFTEYTGFATWAVHIADHKIEQVLRIWFDNHLVYDATGGTAETYPLADDYELDASLRIYLGTETQDPDPDMQAFIEARDGVGTCPAYRGEAYAYFQQVPVEKIGNRFPDVKIELAAFTRAAFTQVSEPSGNTDTNTFLADSLVAVSPSGQYAVGRQSSQVVWSVDVQAASVLSDEWLSGVNWVYSGGSAEGIRPMAVDDEGTVWGGADVPSNDGILARAPATDLTDISEAAQWTETSSSFSGLTVRRVQTFTMPDNSIDVVVIPELAGGSNPHVMLHVKDSGTISEIETNADFLPEWAFQDDNGDIWVIGNVWTSSPASTDVAHLQRLTNVTGASPYAGYFTATIEDVSLIGGGRTNPFLRAHFENGAAVGAILGGPDKDNNEISWFFRIPLDGSTPTTVQAPAGTDYVFSDRTPQATGDTRIWTYSSADTRQAVAFSVSDFSIAQTYDLDDWGVSGDVSTKPVFVPAQGVLLTTYRTGLWTATTGVFNIYSTAAGATLQGLLEQLMERAGGDAAAYDFSAATQVINGYNWTQATGRQVAEPVADLYDVDLVPHDFKLVALPRGSATQGVLAAAEFAKADPLYNPATAAPGDLPQKVSLTYADTSTEQNPNVASPPGPDPASANSSRELAVDMSTLALDPAAAQQMATRRLRRHRVGSTTAEFALTRRRLAIEPGDVWTPDFDGHQMVMRNRKTVLAADGRIETEWERELPEVATLPSLAAAPAAGHKPPVVVESVASVGEVLDIALVSDAHEQSAPFAYLTAGPSAPGTWLGANYAVSDTGELDSYVEAWAGLADGEGAIIGTVSGVLPDVNPWVPDNGSSISVALNYGELTSATMDELLADPLLNLVAIESGEAWELAQFMSATLTGTRTYTLSGFLRGLRGTEWTMAGHADGDRLILLDTLKIKTLGAAELGDTDYYILSSVGAAVDQDSAWAQAFSGAAHKPYAPVYGTQEQSGADLVFDATRRTRIGGANLDGQDVPLGQVSESWALDIMDGATVVRTITGTSLPLTYAEADQITDFGSAQSSVAANLYQVDPTLNLRGYPLAFSA